MAEVTGELGGQPILLENAATEATLYALLQATLATNSNKSQAAKIQQAYEEALKRTTRSQQLHLEQNNKHRQAIAAEVERRDQLNKRIEEEKEKRKKFMQGLSELGGLLQGIGNVIGKTLSFAFSSATPKVTDFTDALSGIPIIGPIIGAVGKAMQDTIDNFRALSSVGADFGNGIDAMRMMAARAGLPLEVFTKAIVENSASLALLGGNTAQGAKIFTAVNKSMQGPFQQGLARLGFSMEETAELTAGYLALQTRLGRAQNMTQAELNEGNKEYLLQIDMLARVHGMTRKEAEKALAEQMTDKRMKLFYAQLGKSGDQTSLFMTGLSKANKEFSDGLADLMLNNGVPSANNEMAKSIALNSPRLMRLSQELRKGTVSQEEANKVVREEAVRLKALAKAQGLTLAQFLNLNSSVPLAVSSIMDMENFGSKAAEAAKDQGKALKDTGKNMANLDKELLALRNQMLKQLMPVFQLFADNIHKVIPALTKFVEDFVKILNDPNQGLGPALTFAFKKLGELVAPAFKAILSEMFTSPWTYAALGAGFLALFGSTLVQLALARAITKSMNRGPGGLPGDIDLPDTPDRPGDKPKPGSPRGSRRFPIPSRPTPGMKFGIGGILMSIPGNIGQDYPWPDEGPYAGKEINPATGGPWSKADLEEYKKDPEAYAKKTPAHGATPASATPSMLAPPQNIAEATTPEAMKLRAQSIIQIKELTEALNKLDYNKLIIPDTANKNIEISTGKMRLLRGEVNALTTSFKNLDETGLSKITKGINSLSGEFRIFNEGFTLFKKKFEELDRTTERGLLESLSDQLDKLNTNAVGIETNTRNSADHLKKILPKVR